MSERSGQRIAAFVLAGVFFFSSVALTGFVIWQIREDSKNEQGIPTQTATNSANNAKEETKPVEQKTLEGFTPITAPVAELQKIDLVEGTGPVVAAGANITVKYTGALASTGVIFESNPATFSLNGVIKGWQDGVPGMKVGGKRRLVIPYTLAYGEQGSPPTIPGKADLVFDIELNAIN